MAGVGVGALYALAATRIKNGGDYGYEVAAGASALLLSSSAPRFRKGPVPMGLTLTSALALAYYGKKVRISVQSCVAVCTSESAKLTSASSPLASQNRCTTSDSNYAPSQSTQPVFVLT